MRRWTRRGFTPACCLRRRALPPAKRLMHRNIIAMQGPFSLALNVALMQQFGVRYLVTKDGGAAGGFAEKVQAAARTGAQLVVLRRPPETGETEEALFTHCQEMLQWSH